MEGFDYIRLYQHIWSLVFSLLSLNVKFMETVCLSRLPFWTHLYFPSSPFLRRLKWAAAPLICRWDHSSQSQSRTQLLPLCSLCGFTMRCNKIYEPRDTEKWSYCRGFCFYMMLFKMSILPHRNGASVWMSWEVPAPCTLPPWAQVLSLLPLLHLKLAGIPLVI